MGGATGEDGLKDETAHEAGGNSGSGATAHGAGENAGSGATAHNAGKEGGEAATAHETGEERGEIATVHGTMREGMAVLIDVNGEKASFAMLQRNRCVFRHAAAKQVRLSPCCSETGASFAMLQRNRCVFRHAAAQQVRLAVSLPLIRRLYCPTTPPPIFSPPPFVHPPPFLRSFLLTARVGKQQCSLAPLIGCPYRLSLFPPSSSLLPVPTLPPFPILPSSPPRAPLSAQNCAGGQAAVLPRAPHRLRLSCFLRLPFILSSSPANFSHFSLPPFPPLRLPPPHPPLPTPLSSSPAPCEWASSTAPSRPSSAAPFASPHSPRPSSPLPPSTDNRNLIDDNTAQKLSANEIEALKRQAASGHEVVRALAANSVSFLSKTDFAQEKYLRKKQKKHAPRLVARFPTADSVCEAYFAKAPARIGFLRPDSLAMLLAMANVGAHSQLLVLDGTGGLITAAAAQRMGGHGAICSAFYASHVSHAPSIDIIRHLNLSLPAAAMYVSATPPSLLPLP
ncbi:unnamed protein product [Closterium sp. Naga37s-1]|nr:unnamed protein product [Closterium sp. Naga37s-1]